MCAIQTRGTPKRRNNAPTLSPASNSETSIIGCAVGLKTMMAIVGASMTMAMMRWSLAVFFVSFRKTTAPS
jgi:hypothetical protein